MTSATNGIGTEDPTGRPQQMVALCSETGLLWCHSEFTEKIAHYCTADAASGKLSAPSAGGS